MKLKKIYMSEDSVSSAQDFCETNAGSSLEDQIKKEVFQAFPEDYEHGGVLMHATVHHRCGSICG